MMAKCIKCGKRGLFLKLNNAGLCNDCEKRAAKTVKSKNIYTPPVVIKIEEFLPNKIDNYILVYDYYNICLNIEDYSPIESCIQNKNYFISIKMENSEIYVYSDYGKIGTMQGTHYSSMATDWIRKNEPFVCKISEIDTTNKTVKINLGFYRDMLKKIQGKKYVTVKLTAYKSDIRQDNILHLSQNDFLFVGCDEYADNPACKVYTSCTSAEEDSYDVIGNLPHKYKEMYLNGDISAITFDHCEEDDYFLSIPFVNIYFY